LTAYVETSAAAKLLVREPQTPALVAFLDSRASTLISSSLLETELRRTALREGIDQELVSAILEKFEIVAPDRAVFVHAGLLPGARLRSLDALHVAAAMAVSAEVIVSYDHRQIEAAHAAGIRTVSPA